MKKIGKEVCFLKTDKNYGENFFEFVKKKKYKKI